MSVPCLEGSFRMLTRILRVVVVLAVVAASASVQTASGAQSARGTISELEVVSEATGTLTLRWIPPVDSPDHVGVLSDYRISWALEGENFATWTDLGRNAFPAAPLSEYTITGLDPGAAYKVRMRTRYNRGVSAAARWSGPWVETAPVAAAPLLSAEPDDDGDVDDSATEHGSADAGLAKNSLELTTRQNANRAPEFAEDDMVWSVPENTVAGIMGEIAATDADGDTLVYSVGPTAESDATVHLTAFQLHFALDTERGQISVKRGATFDLGTRPSYKVLYQVSDLKNATDGSDPAIDDQITLTITVTSVDEPGTVSFSDDPTQGTTLKATLADPDVVSGTPSWIWERSARPDSGFEPIDGETDASYRPVAADSAFFLRATASYTDGLGAGKTASRVTVLPVDVTAGTLVKNTGRVGLRSSIDENVLFAFRTGRNSAGYGLSRIGLKMTWGSVTSPGPVKITTRGRGHSESNTVVTLEAPALLVAGRVNYFMVPAGVMLRADTEYLLSLGNATSVQMTNPRYVNPGGADHWALLQRLRPPVRSVVDQLVPQVEFEGFDLSDSPGAG